MTIAREERDKWVRASAGARGTDAYYRALSKRSTAPRPAWMDDPRLLPKAPPGRKAA